MTKTSSECKQRVGDLSGIQPAANTVWNMCIIKVRIRDGRIWAIEPDDTINSGIAREDGHLSDELIDKCMITNRRARKDTPTSVIYIPRPRDLSMKRVGRKAAASGANILG